MTTAVLEQPQSMMAFDVSETHTSHVIAYLEGVLDGSLDVRANYPPSKAASAIIQDWVSRLESGSLTLTDIQQAIHDIEDITVQMQVWCIAHAAIESDPGFGDWM